MRVEREELEDEGDVAFARPAHRDFLAVEQDNSHGTTVGAVDESLVNHYTVHQPKIYAKLNWNINDANVFSLTGLQSQNKVWSSNNDFDYATLQSGGFAGLGQTSKTSFRTWIANYSSYLTDNLTLNAMLGKMHGEYFTNQPAFPGYDPSLPHIASCSYQDPAFLPPDNSCVSNAQGNSSIANPAHRESITNYRVSFDYKWHTHDFQIGIDNICWEADYPHSDSMWPGAPEQLDEVLAANNVPPTARKWKVLPTTRVRWPSNKRMPTHRSRCVHTPTTVMASPCGERMIANAVNPICVRRSCSHVRCMARTTWKPLAPCPDSRCA